MGLATAKRLHESGLGLVCISRSLSPELEALLEAAQGAVQFFPVDIGDIDRVQDQVKLAVKETGPIWGLVNNAAVGRDGVLATMHQQDIVQMINVNVTGTILLTKTVVRSMLAQQNGGSIVNVSSIIASTGYNGLSAYAATKSAMLGFTRSLARELGRANIRVNSVSPGYMETEMSSGLGDEKLATITRRSPLGRLAVTDEVAAAIDFLMSEQASAITGTNLVVDAGSTA